MNLREWRLGQGKTIDEAAELFQTTAATVSRIETGSQWISETLLGRIVAVTGLSIDDLFDARQAALKKAAS